MINQKSDLAMTIQDYITESLSELNIYPSSIIIKSSGKVNDYYSDLIDAHNVKLTLDFPNLRKGEISYLFYLFPSKFSFEFLQGSGHWFTETMSFNDPDEEPAYQYIRDYPDTDFKAVFPKVMSPMPIYLAAYISALLKHGYVVRPSFCNGLGNFIFSRSMNDKKRCQLIHVECRPHRFHVWDKDVPNAVRCMEMSIAEVHVKTTLAKIGDTIFSERITHRTNILDAIKMLEGM